MKDGLFSIKQKKGPVNFELDLLTNKLKSKVFHISLLEPVDADTPTAQVIHYQDQDHEEYEVEKILDQQGQKYLIKWKDCDNSENTWEPLRHLTNCQELIQQFQKERKAASLVNLAKGNSRRRHK